MLRGWKIFRSILPLILTILLGPNLWALTDVCTPQWMSWPEQLQTSSKKEVVKKLGQLNYHERLELLFNSKSAKTISRAKSASGPGYCSYKIKPGSKEAKLVEHFVVPGYLLKAGDRLSLVVSNQFESYGNFQTLCENRLNKIRNQARLKHGDDSIIHRVEGGLLLSSSATEQWSMKTVIKEFSGRFIVFSQIRNPKFQGELYCQIQPE